MQTSTPSTQVPAWPAGRGHRLVGERTVRLATGLTLFAYATCHFLSHATGVFHLETMETVGRGVLLAPWRTPVGQTILFGSLVTHAALGLLALVRRRHLRMPAMEALQLGLGLLIPLLMIPHAANVRLGSILYRLDDSYFRLVYQYWLTSPLSGLTRQFFLLIAVWVHGCLGLHMYLRFRPWYRPAMPWLIGVAVLIPFLAVLGISSAGWDATMRAATTPGFAAYNGPPPAGSEDAAHRALLETLWDDLRIGYVALVAGAFGYRALRLRRARRRGGVRILYPDHAPVVVPRGFSVLEASRWAGIPHTSICGGRARCSTCRVRITSGHERLPPPSAIEWETLDRIKAPAQVRLACQLRPRHDVGVALLVPSQAEPHGLRVAGDDAVERTVTALSIDLRDSTTLAVDKLPFDALFIVDRYVQSVTGVIETNGGHVTSVAGDGVMSVFGFAGDAAKGARDALAAAFALWERLDRLSVELAHDLRGSLRFGIGVHTGPSVLGSITVRGSRSLQFLGDTGNVAARLEALSKDLASTLVLSEAVLEAAGLTPPAALTRQEIPVRGRGDAPLRVVIIRDKNEMASLRREFTAA